MNWYFYWYFTIYNIYKNLSRDKYFDIFATSMFSFFVASLIIGSSSYVFVFLNMSNLLFSTSVTTIAIFGIVFISNYILFLPKERQLKQFEEYKINQNGTKDLFAILFSVFSIGIYFSVILLGKDISLDIKKRGTPLEEIETVHRENMFRSEMKYSLRTFYKVDKSDGDFLGTGYPMLKFINGKIISNYIWQTKKEIYVY